MSDSDASSSTDSDIDNQMLLRELAAAEPSSIDGQMLRELAAAAPSHKRKHKRKRKRLATRLRKRTRAIDAIQRRWLRNPYVAPALLLGSRLALLGIVYAAMKRNVGHFVDVADAIDENAARQDSGIGPFERVEPVVSFEYQNQPSTGGTGDGDTGDTGGS